MVGLAFIIVIGDVFDIVAEFEILLLLDFIKKASGDFTVHLRRLIALLLLSQLFRPYGFAHSLEHEQNEVCLDEIGPIVEHL